MTQKKNPVGMGHATTHAPERGTVNPTEFI